MDDIGSTEMRKWQKAVGVRRGEEEERKRSSNWRIVMPKPETYIEAATECLEAKGLLHG
jgi:hypothetical protein